MIKKNIKKIRENQRVNDRLRLLSNISPLAPKQLRSKFEEEVKDTVKKYFFSSFKENFFPTWFVNPKTQRLLELDIFIPQSSIAIEVQDKYHFVNSKVKMRDEIKRKTCVKMEIDLIEIPYFTENIYEFLNIAFCHIEMRRLFLEK